MMNSIKSGAGVSDRSPDRKSPKRDADGMDSHLAESAREPAPAPGSDLRLVIERDAEGAYYIYKLIDRATGKVVAERPRDQVTSLADGPEYRAGTVVSTKA